jgi:hypothetical protein
MNLQRPTSCSQSRCTRGNRYRGYFITKDVNDFSVMPLVRAAAGARVVKIPAPFACYWLGLLEVEAAGRQ